MKVVLYARISTDEDRQDTLTQLLPLRQYAESMDLEVWREYVDTASARDLVHRRAWRQLLDDAAHHHFKAVLVFKLDRAFRSVKDMCDTLAAWEACGVTFKSIREEFDTSTAAGRLMMNLLAALAEFELELIRERVMAGMDRAKRLGTRSGKPIGRRRLTDSQGFDKRATSIVAQARYRLISLAEGARQLGISKSSFKRLVDGKHISQMEEKLREIRDND